MCYEIGFRLYAQHPAMLGDRKFASSSGFSTPICLPWKALSVYRAFQYLCHKLFLGIFHPKISKISYQHGSKNEQVPRYPVLCRNLRIAIKTADLPFHIRYDSHVMAVASYNKQVFIVHA